MIVATDLYPKFNPILEIYKKTISCVKNALPQHIGRVLAAIGLHWIKEPVEARNLQETQDETSITAPAS
jgi:hypothetical protein